MIDSHCHLTYSQLSDQLDAVLARAAEAGVVRMITIGTTVADARLAVDLCSRHANIRCAVGIHPHHAAEVAPDDLAALRELERRPEVLALGEMGLDYHYDFSPRPRQQEIFAQQLQLAEEQNRPLVIHCREAFDDCFAILKGSSRPAVFHCFTGNRAEARRILDAGYLIGFTGVVTFKKSDELREVVKLVPMDRMLLETDAPYLSPEPLRRQKVNEPSFIIHTAAAIAQIKQLPVEEIDRATTANTQRFFAWPA